MMDFRLCRVLPVLLLMAGAAQARPLPVSQPPAEQKQLLPALKDHPGPGGYGNPFLWSCLADLAHGWLSQGERACGQAIAFDPKDPNAYDLRGYAYLIERRFELAEADFRAALKLTPKSAQDLAGYGQSLTGLGQFAEAVTQFSKAVALAPANAAYRNGLCWARAGTGKNLKRALADCNAALLLVPGTPGPLNSRGLVELRLGRFNTAITDYTAALAVRPQLPPARFGRGLAHLELGQIAAGGADILGARNADPEIDALFVQLGVLSRECGQGKQQCPAGFPPVSQAPDYREMAVVLKDYPQEDNFLAIEAGRLEVMVDQIALVLRVPQTGEHDGTMDRQDMPERLSTTAARFQFLAPLACSRHISKTACGVWHPSWIKASQSDLGAVVDESYAHIRPVWAALCASHENICRTE